MENDGDDFDEVYDNDFGLKVNEKIFQLPCYGDLLMVNTSQLLKRITLF
jgi:hypothetical protein